MSSLENKFPTQGDNIKRALRDAAEHLETTGQQGRLATIHVTSLVSVDPPQSGSFWQVEEVFDLVGGVVFIKRLAQLGIPCNHEPQEYRPFEGNTFTAGITREIDDEALASEALAPYHQAILDLSGSAR